MLTFNLTKPVGFLLLPVLILVLGACSSAGPRYQQDYRPGTDFGVYRSYDWRATRSQLDTLSDERLRALAGQALSAGGYQRDTESPDILLSVNALSRPNAKRGDKSVGVSVGLPVGDRGHLGLGGNKRLPKEGEREGILLLDIFDARENRMIWRGSAEGIAMRRFEPKREDQLRAILEQLVGRFPPD